MTAGFTGGAGQWLTADTLLCAGFAGMFFFLPVGSSPVTICGVFVLSLWLLSGRFIRDIAAWARQGSLRWPVMLLMILPWVGLLYTPVPSDGLNIAKRSYYWLFAIALAPVLSSRRRSDVVILAFLAGLSCNSAVAVLQVSGLLPMQDALAAGLLRGSSMHIVFTLFLAAGILIASFYFSRADTRTRRLGWALLLAQYGATAAFVGGRSGYAALIILCPVVVYNLMGQRNIAIIALVCLVLIAALFASPLVRERFSKAREDITRYQQGDIRTSVGLRFHMWRIALEEIKRHPLQGVGTGGFKKSWDERKGDPALPFYDHPHNSFLYMAVSHGLPGLAALCWLLLAMLKKGRQAAGTPLGFAVLSFTAVFIIGSLSDTQVLTFSTAISLALFAGAAEAAHAG
jgi:O-antigen ligase